MRACRLIRVKRPCTSPSVLHPRFLMATQAGITTRWDSSPKPAYVPLFESHAHHIQWVEAQLAAGTMQNVRHLWVSVRPNGVRRPYELNRLELRICDLVTDPIALLAIAWRLVCGS